MKPRYHHNADTGGPYRTKKVKLQTSERPHVTEKQIQQACSDFLALDGWRRVRTDLPHLRGLGVQEKGMADDLYIRYMEDAWFAIPPTHTVIKRGSAACEVMWIEHKRRTGKVAAHQHAWHAQERARGALTLIAGIDFVASVDGFMDWYFKSGLARSVRDSRKREAGRHE